MKLLKKIAPEIPLRVSFALMYLWSGYDLLTNPEDWLWALEKARAQAPPLLQNALEATSPEQILQIQGGVEILFALLLLFWFVPHRIIRLVALAIAVELGAILLLVGVDSLTFRDIGLLGGAFSLFLLVNKKA